MDVDLDDLQTPKAKPELGATSLSTENIEPKEDSELEVPRVSQRQQNENQHNPKQKQQNLVISKRTLSKNTPEEAKELQELYTQLRDQLTVSRAARPDKQIQAIWMPQWHVARVQQKYGKMDNLGYNIGSAYYLQYYETLFLLELGRLNLRYLGEVVSIERAYILLLGRHRFNEYLVYSNLTRVGFILREHRRQSREKEEKGQNSERDCVWAVLDHKISKKPIRQSIRDSECFESILKQFESIEKSIKQQESKPFNESEPWVFKVDFKKSGPNKRKALTEPPATSMKRSFQGKPKSLLDILKSDPEYEQFKSKFQSFELVELNSSYSSQIWRPLRISFDLYLHNDGFKRSSPKTPTLHIVVLSNRARFPTHDELSECMLRESDDVPLLVVSVSESKQLHAFLYHISYVS